VAGGGLDGAAGSSTSTPPVARCRNCGLIRFPEERFYRGLCPACLEADKGKRRRAAGARILAKAKDAGTVERDGQTFRVVQLDSGLRGVLETSNWAVGAGAAKCVPLPELR
jgi:hypothetical protein